MGEILGLGVTHYPPLMGLDQTMADILRGILKDPGLPQQYREPSGWPEQLRKEYGMDGGASAATAHRERLVGHFRRARRALDEFRPDVVIVWGDDQYENFKEDIIPPFCVFAYEDMEVYPYHPERDRLDQSKPISAFGRPAERPHAANAWDEPEDTKLHVRGKRDAAKYLARGLLKQKVDVAYAYQPLHYDGLCHAFLNTVMFLDWDRVGFDYPVVPMQVNCYGSRVILNRGGTFPVGAIDLPEGDLDPPGPSPERCMEVGAAVVRVLKNSPWRVAVVASSSWSHAFLTAKHFFVYPDVESDRKLYDALLRGDYAYWRGVSNEEVDACGQQEVRNWWCLVGAMEELGHSTPAHHAFVESYIMNSSKCFAVWEPR